MRINAKLTVKNQEADAIIEFLINSRAYPNKELFLNPPHPDKIIFKDLFDDPKKITSQIKKLKKLIDNCLKNNKTIVVYGDYDADGVCATAIMWETLNNLKCAVFPFIPNRKTHGYGLSRQGIDEVIKKYNPALIVTVDNGITATEGVSYAKKKGVSVVITDHHNVPDKLPNADAIIHTTLVSGSGLSFFICKELEKEFKKNISHSDHLLLSAIGSIADLVPVVGPTRSLIVYGLKEAASINKYGLRLILGDKKEIGVIDIGYSIAPKINVFGRIGDAMDALRLICTKDYKRAYEIYLKSQKLSDTRKQLTNSAKYNIKPKINDNIVAVVSDDLDEGIIGLVAADYVKKYSKPAFVVCQSNELYKGSVRSTIQVDCAKLLKQLNGFTLSSGGHKMAGGFLIEKENIDSFLKKANSQVLKFEKKDEYFVDVHMPINYSHLEFVKKILQLGPFGPGNETPVFASAGVIHEIIQMGKTKKHARIKIEDVGSYYDFVYFNGSDYTQDLKGQKVTLVYQLEIDSWGGVEKPMRKVISIV